mmetsp:Transcript_7079/g.17394  ORF Transcript_7079/g.17394 Transcript_7079/m.17394 type:complete len:344 (+) Transcript_7079:174-1205(+)
MTFIKHFTAGLLFGLAFSWLEVAKVLSPGIGNATKKNNIITAHQYSRVKFVPFPHRNVGTGDVGAGCNWSTVPISDDDMPETYDLIQRAAFREGICIPSSDQRLHVFSTAQAIECLSSTVQHRNISLIMSGDSYNRQLFIGLVDILLGRAWNVEILNGGIRKELTEQAFEEIKTYVENDPNFPLVQFVCIEECYGRQTLERCSRCINQLVNRRSDTVAVVGTFVHVLVRHKDNVTATYDEITKFIEETDNLIFNSNPCYETSKIPRQYQNASREWSAELFYDKLLPLMASYNKMKPFMDFFQLTRSCTMNNCSTDGGHRARYVNRWKAQILLNTICTIEEQHL